MSYSREQFTCANCTGLVWLFGDELPDAPCPHCGRPVADLQMLEDPLAQEPDPRSAPTIDLATFEPDAAVSELVSTSVVRELGFLPVEYRDGVLTIAVPRDTSSDMVTRIRFILARDVTLVVAPEDAILNAINRYYP